MPSPCCTGNVIGDSVHVVFTSPVRWNFFISFLNEAPGTVSLMYKLSPSLKRLARNLANTPSCFEKSSVAHHPKRPTQPLFCALLTDVIFQILFLFEH